MRWHPSDPSACEDTRSPRLRFASAVTLLAFLAMVSICDVSSAATADAHEPASEVTIDSLVAEALAQNPEAAFYEAEVAAAEGKGITAGARANPEVVTTAGSKRVTQGGLTDEGVAWSVSVRQTFEWPGRVALRKAIASQQQALAELGLEQFKTALAGRVRVLAHELFAAQQTAGAAAEVAGRLRSLREVLVQREPAGLAPVLETRIIEATELVLGHRASDSAVAERRALLELNQLRGRPGATALRIAAPALSFAPAPDLERFVSEAEQNNFELRTRGEELKQQGLQVLLSRNEARPAVSVGPYVSQERAGDVETQAGIGLSLPGLTVE